MKKPYKCIMCGRVIAPENTAYRYPQNYPAFADMVYAKFLELRGITGTEIVLPKVCTESSSDIAEKVEQDGKTILITNTGRIVERKVCPSCHFPIYRASESDMINTVVVFGMKNSGKTSLVLSIADEVVKQGFDIADNMYVCVLNDLCTDPKPVKNISAALSEDKKSDDVRTPVHIFRIASVQSGNSDKSDVFYDTACNDVSNEVNIDMLIPNALNADTFVFAVDAETLLFSDSDGRLSADMEMRQSLYPLVYAAQYSSLPPKLMITVTKTDKLYDEGVPSECRESVCKRIVEDGAVREFFFENFPLSMGVAEKIGDLDFFAVSGKTPCAAPDSENSVVELYKKLIV